MHDLDSAADLSDSFEGFGVGGTGGNDYRLLSRLGTVLETTERDIHRMFPKHYLFQSVGDNHDD
jgi:hypothetical protein